MALHLRAQAKRAAAIGGVGVLAAFSVAACGTATPGGTSAVGTGGDTSTAPGGAGSVPATSPGDGNGGATSAGDSGTSGDAGTDVRRCRPDQLEASLGSVEAAAGSRYAPLVFTNVAEQPCRLRGYPGVTLLNSGKEQIGPDADRASGNPVRSISLAPDESASALLRWASPVAGECRPTSSYLRAYPPGATETLVIPAKIELCGDVFTVRAVTGGTHGGAD